MKKLYFARHGESEANFKQLFAGRWDIPLTDLGRLQARQAGSLAKGLKIDCIVSSPLIRAQETAEIIASEIGYPANKIIYSDLFMERDYGDLQGQPWRGIKITDFDKIPNIEKGDKLSARAIQAAQFLSDIKADNVLLVGHGTMGRTIRDYLLRQHGDIEVSIENELPNSQIVEWI
jgi:uncharacterized phosphatase